MLVPVEFQKLCCFFDQDMMLIHRSLEAAIAYALDALNADERVVVRDFLDELLSGHHNDEEIDQVWQESRAQIGFTNARELIIVLGLIREMIALPQK
jgi:hypothetical protein